MWPESRPLVNVMLFICYVLSNAIMNWLDICSASLLTLFHASVLTLFAQQVLPVGSSFDPI